jgi:hypothetical protein
MLVLLRNALWMTPMTPGSESLLPMAGAVYSHSEAMNPVHSEPGVTLGAVHMSQGSTADRALGEAPSMRQAASSIPTALEVFQRKSVMSG